MGSDDWNVQALTQLALADARAATWCACQTLLYMLWDRASEISEESRLFAEDVADTLSSWVDSPTVANLTRVRLGLEMSESRILKLRASGFRADFPGDDILLSLCSLILAGTLVSETQEDPDESSFWLYAAISETFRSPTGTQYYAETSGHSPNWGGWGGGLSRGSVRNFHEFVDNLLKTCWSCVVPSAQELLQTPSWAAVLWDQTDPVGDNAQSQITLSDLVRSYGRCVGPVASWEDPVIRALYERDVL